MTLSANINKLNFYSGDPIDKVVATGSGFTAIVIVNDGDTTADALSGGAQEAKIVSSSIPNPYGQKCFVRYNWSVDFTNYNSPLSHIDYTFNYNLVAPAPPSTTVLSGLKAAVSVGVSDNQITFLTANGFHGDVSDNGTTVTYTPTSQTFAINYALFTLT